MKRKQSMWMYLRSYCLQICLMMKSPRKLFSSKRSNPVELSVQAIIPFLRSNALDTGITVEVKTRKQGFIHQT